MDVHDFLRLLTMGFRFKHGVRLLVADPPCTPWSRAGKREGTSDERDMLVPTCEIIKLLRPQAYLIGNVPGLDDGPNLGTVQKIIGSLHTHGYCTADFARLDAANYGVPQHRIRPFWFGHLAGPCVQWPAPTHGDPKDLLNQPTLPGVDALLPWITCGQALRHLPPEEIGRPVKLRWRSQNSDQHGSVPDKPARVVGTSNLSDGNVLVEGVTPHKRGKKPKVDHRPTNAGTEPAKTITRNTHSDGCLLVGDEIAEIMGNDKHRPLEHDKPASTIGAKSRGNGSSVMEIEATTNHPPSFVDEPAMTVRATDGGGSRVSLQVSGKRGRKRDEGMVGQGNRVGDPNQPGSTLTAKASRVGAGESHVLEWPWDRPATTVYDEDRLAPPGHHDKSFMSNANAVVISEKAAAILQGFDPDKHVFVGETKKARWSQIGQAMPPPLARAVATSVKAQIDKTVGEAKRFPVIVMKTDMDGNPWPPAEQS
jgi:site-specific DNA-cytosine methylase